jgi:hypothetical protein
MKEEHLLGTIPAGAVSSPHNVYVPGSIWIESTCTTMNRRALVVTVLPLDETVASDVAALEDIIMHFQSLTVL